MSGIRIYLVWVTPVSMSANHLLSWGTTQLSGGTLSSYWWWASNDSFVCCHWSCVCVHMGTNHLRHVTTLSAHGLFLFVNCRGSEHERDCTTKESWEKGKWWFWKQNKISSHIQKYPSQKGVEYLKINNFTNGPLSLYYQTGSCWLNLVSTIILSPHLPYHSCHKVVTSGSFSSNQSDRTKRVRLWIRT